MARLVGGVCSERGEVGNRGGSGKIWASFVQ